MSDFHLITDMSDPVSRPAWRCADVTDLTRDYFNGLIVAAFDVIHSTTLTTHQLLFLGRVFHTPLHLRLAVTTVGLEKICEIDAKDR